MFSLLLHTALLTTSLKLPTAMASRSKSLLTVNAIMSTIILSSVFISAHLRQTEAYIIPADNEKSSKSIIKTEPLLSHRMFDYMVDESNYPHVDSGQVQFDKHSWNGLHKRLSDSVLYSDGGTDEYNDLMLLLSQPYFRNAEALDIDRPIERENINANNINDLMNVANENKRTWTSSNDYWPKRFSPRNSADRIHGMSICLNVNNNTYIPIPISP